MKWSFASVGLIILGMFGIIIIMLFNDITVSNEQDYYTLKDATEAAMIEAVDVAYYRLTGEVKISQEKFVENFTRRFVETSTFGQGNYSIEFYQISEFPAKVSVRIVDKTNSYSIYTSFNPDLGNTEAKIVNEISAILDGYRIDIDVDKAVKKINKGIKGECKADNTPNPEYTCESSGLNLEGLNYEYQSNQYINDSGEETIICKKREVGTEEWTFQLF